ncbi:divergent polysaccharide deacetylase family protein [Atopomonas hussainii]|uniref:divergent polysaccharide deacetylase family protein n=1 Tax=Atopomonas hussainii TaxID=1429083 RepID=UPI000A8F5DD6|nr:divergent polysaccharide deacetylase family protein [Atopomonas hussainii]
MSRMRGVSLCLCLLGSSAWANPAAPLPGSLGHTQALPTLPAASSAPTHDTLAAPVKPTPPSATGKVAVPAPTSAAPLQTDPSQPKVSKPTLPPAPNAYWLSIIIDDLGGNLTRDRQVMALAPEIALAIMPDTAHSKTLAHEAREQGHTILLHMPMAPATGPYALSPEQSPTERAERLHQALQQVPGASGVNNHMGSRMTSDRAGMQQLMQLLAAKRLFFVDSRTSAATQAAASAQQAQLASLSRDVFLDDQNDLAHIRSEWRKGIALAKQQGSALLIGHPYPATLQVLREELPKLASQQIQLLPLKPLIALRGNRAMAAHGSGGIYQPKTTTPAQGGR